MANPVKVVGQGIVYLGIGAIFLMSVIGAFSLDLLFIYLLSQNSNRRSSFGDLILTLYLWNMLFNTRSSFYENIGISIILSPFISAITVGLAFALGAPEFGALLLLGWAGAFTIVLVGATIYATGDVLEAAFEALSDLLSTIANSFTFERRAQPSYDEAARLRDELRMEREKNQKLTQQQRNEKGWEEHHSPLFAPSAPPANSGDYDQAPPPYSENDGSQPYEYGMK